MKKSKKESYKTQRNTARDNENRILKALLPYPKTFTELMNQLNISHTGLSKILGRLQTKGQIKKVEYSKAYELTVKGNKTVKAFPIIQDSMESILGGKYNYSNETGKFSLEYKGINLDILSDVQVVPELSGTFEEIVEECLKKSENTIAEIPRIIGDKSELKGKMVLALTIDFDDMREQFLNRNNKTWKKYGLKWENENDWGKLFSGDDPK